MNETLKIIANRTSLRAFAPKPLEQDVIDTIIWGAMRAPTAGNMMLYSIIHVADQEKKATLARTCDNQPFIAKAPLVLLFLADMQRWYDLYEASGIEELCEREGLELRTPQESDLLLACCDALVAAHNAVITAESLGIGSCYIGDIMEHFEIHQEIFDLPKLVFPITLVCFGYYPEKRRKPTPRFPQKYIHFQDRYQRLSSDELREMLDHLKERHPSGERYIGGAQNIGQHYYLKKTGAAFASEMERSVKVAIDAWLSYRPTTHGRAK